MLCGLRTLCLPTMPKKSSFPKPLIILGIVILILAFVGSFGYSFFKSKIEAPAGTFADFAKLACQGKLGELPPNMFPDNMTVKTKAEGIETCKKSGMQECYALVAVSFQDLSICKQAQDKKACETQANQIIKE